MASASDPRRVGISRQVDEFIAKAPDDSLDLFQESLRAFISEFNLRDRANGDFENADRLGFPTLIPKTPRRFRIRPPPPPPPPPRYSSSASPRSPVRLSLFATEQDSDRPQHDGVRKKKNTPPMSERPATPPQGLSFLREHIRRQLSTPYQKGNYSSGTTEYVIEGKVDGIKVSALPDTGSDECIISSSFASKLGQQTKSGTNRMITLANRKKVLSPGMVEVIWKFGQESVPHKLKCWVLPNCSHDIILGSRFLETTKTLTSFLHRVKKRLIPRRLRLRLLGQEKKRLMGILNGRNTTALADTGSDLMLVSAEYARLKGLSVSSGKGDRVEVELADGTRTWTSGIVRDATWTLGDLTVRCDFHVLEDLSVDVILSKDYIFELEVFSKHGDLFFDMDLMEELSFLCGVRLVNEEAYDLDALEGDFMRDVTSEGAFNLEKIRRERVRRMRARERIAKLPANQRQAAENFELSKNDSWDVARKQHKELWNRDPKPRNGSTGVNNSSSSSTLVSSSNTQLRKADRQGGRPDQ